VSTPSPAVNSDTFKCIERGADITTTTKFCSMTFLPWYTSEFGGCSMDITDLEKLHVYPPHEYECDETGNGRSCMACGLLEGGASHNLEPVKQCRYDAASNVIRVAFESGATGFLPIEN